MNIIFKKDNSIICLHKGLFISLVLSFIYGCSRENDIMQTPKNDESPTLIKKVVKKEQYLSHENNDVHTITNVSELVDVKGIRSSLIRFKDIVDAIYIDTENKDSDTLQRLKDILNETPNNWTEKDWEILKDYVVKSTNEIDGIWLEHISTFRTKYSSTGNKEIMGQIAYNLIDIGANVACPENRYFFLTEGALYLHQVDGDSAATIAIETANEMYEKKQLSSECVKIIILLAAVNQHDNAEKLALKLTEDPTKWKNENERLYTKLFAAYTYITEGSPSRIRAIEILNNMATDKTVSQIERDYFSGYLETWRDSPEYKEFHNNQKGENKSEN